MTFYEPGRKFPIAAIFILLIIGGVGGTIFFSLKECGSSGILRSGKTSDATELYQVFPVKNGNDFHLISLEGVFKTRIYERQGGITTRSGSTDVRLTIHDLKSGAELNRIVLGDYHEAYTKILGAGNNVIWLYNAKDGLHSRSTDDLKTITMQEQMIAANKDLTEGLAKADPYLGNLDELYAYDQKSNELMVTTISGKTVWINAQNFATEPAPAVETKQTDLEDMVNEIFEQAKHGVQVDINNLSSKIIEMASDMTSFSDIDHQGDRVLGFDSCEYKFEGETVRTLTRTKCPEPKKINNTEETGKTFIEPAFLSYYNTQTKQYSNPVFLGNSSFLILHAKSIGSNVDLMLSMLDAKTLKPIWTTKTGIVLNNQRSGYQVTGIFGNADTLFTCIDNFLYAFNLQNGKIIWKTTIGTNDYNEQLFFVGDAFQNSKHYFLTANNYFTVLSKEGIFIHGRTDYKLMVMDGATGKVLKKMEVTDSKPEQLPYYLGMSNGACWFYSKSLGIHTRSLPDLKPASTSFFELVKNAGINSELVVTSGYDDAVENKYIAFNEKNNSVYFTTQNGLHYQYNLISGKINEVTAPSDENYEDFMKENSHVNFYRTHLSYMYQHELYFADGRSVETTSNNSTVTFHIKENISAGKEESAQQLKTNQFINAKILTNGVSINGSPLVTDNNRTPLSTNAQENNLYILHKDKIAPDAHLIISKYDADNETLLWKTDVNELLLTYGEITRIYTLDNQLIFIFKTHPDLDDFFTCVSIDSKTGKANWTYKF